MRTTTPQQDFTRGIWRENPVLIQMLGLCPALAVTNTVVNTIDTASCPIVVDGDVNLSGSLTSADIINMVGTVFKSDFRFTRCYAQGDVICDGALTAADIIYTVNAVFKSGPLPCDVCPLIWNGLWECE